MSVSRAIRGLHSAVRSSGNPTASVLWTWGRGDSGQLGHGDEIDENFPRRLDHLSNQIGIACGLYHSASWCERSFYLWGKGTGGRLGFGNEENCYFPATSKVVPPIHSASLGGLHTLVLSQHGDVYSFGYGGFGALGHKVFTREVSPRLIEECPWKDNNEKIVQVSSGGAHSAALSSSGSVFTWGRDEGDGRLGHPLPEDTAEDGSCPFPVVVGNIPAMAEVSCGGFFTMALSVEGQVWAWGGNQNSELGRGPKKPWHKMPGVVTGVPTRVVQIASGGYHGAALDEEGRVWTWGRGGHGQLGHDSRQTEHIPRVVSGLSGNKIQKVACGGAWTAAITEEGQLFCWGRNTERQVAPFDSQTIIASPHLVSFPENVRVEEVALGASHGLVVTLCTT